MKTLSLLVLLASAAFGTQAMASEYKCATQACSYSDGCSTINYYLNIDGSTVTYWMSLENAYHPDGVDYSNLANVPTDLVQTGTIGAQEADGNFTATGEGLKSASEPANSAYLYRELKIYGSLVNGAQYGRFTEVTHLRYAKNPNKERIPIQVEYKCSLMK